MASGRPDRALYNHSPRDVNDEACPPRPDAPFATGIWILWRDDFARNIIEKAFKIGADQRDRDYNSDSD